jgi:hypothetical protein
MFANSWKIIATALGVAAFVVPAAQGGGSARPTPAEISRLGAQTEAQGFVGLSRYLVTRFGSGLSAADVSRLGSETEAQGYRAISTHLVQQASAVQVVPSPAGFAWRDALVGGAFTAGLFLIGGAAALLLRSRHVLPQLRH